MAVLVDRVVPGSVSIELVNLNPSQPRDVIIQAGAFGEHQFTMVQQVVHYPHQFHTIGRKFFQVRLGPGAGGRLKLKMKRFVNQPTYAFPWHGDTIPVR